MRPLCIDLFCGLGGWAEGFLAEGWDVIGFDIERHRYPRIVSLMPHSFGTKLPHDVNESIRNGKSPARWTNPAEHYIGRTNGGDWFGSAQDCSLQRRASSGSHARKAASAQIAKIPFPLAQWIAKCYKPVL